MSNWQPAINSGLKYYEDEPHINLESHPLWHTLQTIILHWILQCTGTRFLHPYLYVHSYAMTFWWARWECSRLLHHIKTINLKSYIEFFTMSSPSIYPKILSVGLPFVGYIMWPISLNLFHFQYKNRDLEIQKNKIH